MNINYSNQTSFEARISDPVKKLLQIQMHREGKKTRLLATKQIDNIKNWGPENCELVFVKNPEGNIGLGVRYPLNDNVNGAWIIERLNSRTLLTSVLKLQQKHIENTINNIIYLYKTHGAQIFERSKVQTIYDKVRSWQS